MRREQWEKAMEWPLTAVALIFLAAYALPIIDTDLPSGPYAIVVNVTWVIFGLDYLIRVALSEDRWGFVRKHPLDLLVVALPILRPLRLLRLIALLSVLNRYAGGGSLRGRVATYLVGSASLLILVASLAVLDAERGQPDANIDDYGDAVWWAMTTMTTVGYGDRFPVTGTGRLVAAALMLGGIAVLGTVTATLASYLVERVQEAEEDAQAATRADVRALRDEVALLRAVLLEHQREASAATPLDDFGKG